MRTTKNNTMDNRTGKSTVRKRFHAKRMVAVFCALMICVAALISFPLNGLAADEEVLDATETTAAQVDPSIDATVVNQEMPADDPAPADDTPTAEETVEETAAPAQDTQDEPVVSAQAATVSVTQEGKASHTVIFEVDGAEWHREEVLDGTLVPMPADPTGAAKFLAWFKKGEDTPFNPVTRITEDTKLVAVFSEQHVVKFMNTDGSLLKAVVVDDGSTVSQSDASPTIPMGSSLNYWRVAGTDSKYDFASPVRNNLVLEPVLTGRAMAVFVTGGPDVDVQTGVQGFKAEAPDAALMQRDGYTFSHWSNEENGIQKFDFANTPINGTTYIYAVWTPDKVGYILNYYNEKANISHPGNPQNADSRGDYELVYTKVISAKSGANAGEKPSIDAAFANANYASGGEAVTEVLNYSDFVYADAKELSGVGNTIINVYYQRTVFEYKFDLTKMKNGNKAITSWIKVRGNDDANYGTNGVYTVRAKLGQDISSLWPLESGMDNNTSNLRPVSWNGFYGSGTKSLTAMYIRYGMNGGMHTTGRPKTFTTTLVMDWKAANYTELRHYYTEILDGEDINGEDVVAFTPVRGTDRTTRYYRHAMDGTMNYQTADPGTAAQALNTSGSGWPGTEIPGFERVQTKDQLAAFLEVNKLGTSDGATNYDLNYYMRRQSFDLKLVTNGGMFDEANGFAPEGGNYAKKFQYEAQLALPSNPEKTRATFDGWYLDETFQTKYEPSMTMPAHDMTLYAKYIGTDVTVNYYDGGSEPVKTNMYALNEPLSAHNLSGTIYDGVQIGDKVPGKGIFRGWYYAVGNTDATVAAPLDMRLTRTEYNMYADFGLLDYTVTFVSEDATFKTATVTSGARNTLALQGHYESEFRPVREGYTFQGWNTRADGSGERFNTATAVLDDITIYAQWTAHDTVTPDSGDGGTTPVTPDDGDGGTTTDDPSIPMDESTPDGGGNTVTPDESAADDTTDTTGQGTPAAAVVNNDTTPPAGTAGGNGVVPTIPANNADTQMMEIEGNEIPTTTLGDAEIPLYGQAGYATWSLLNLILCISGGLLALTMIIASLVRRKGHQASEEQGEDRQKKVRVLWLALAIIMAVVGLVTFLLTEDITTTMVWVDGWTPLMAIWFAAGIVSAALIFGKKQDDDTRTEE